MDKHSSLLRKFVKYGQKSFITIPSGHVAVGQPSGRSQLDPGVSRRRQRRRSRRGGGRHEGSYNV